MADLEQCSAIRDGVRVFYVVVQLGGFVPQLSVSGKARGIRAFCVLQRPMPGSWRKYQKEFFYRFAGRQFRGNV
ncbi:hypothetical protein ACIGJK_13710 [Pseudomonas iridis]